MDDCRRHFLSAVNANDLRKEFPVTQRDSEIVKDAMRRWSFKDMPAEKSMKNRIPIVIYLKNQRCVVLKLRLPSIGGDPVYCYDIRKDVIVEANDEVE